MNKIILSILMLALALLVCSGCANISSAFTPDSDKQLNLQNQKAARQILEDPEATPKIKSTADDIKKNSEQLANSSIGLPKDTAVPYTPKNSDKFRKESKQNADNNWTDVILGIAAASNIPWVVLLVTLLGYWRQIRKTYRERGIKEALFDGVDKILDVSNPKTARAIKTIMKSEAAASNIHKEIKKDLKARR